MATEGAHEGCMDEAEVKEGTGCEVVTRVPPLVIGSWTNATVLLVAQGTLFTKRVRQGALVRWY